MSFMSVRFKKLSSNGHDEWEAFGEEIEKEFQTLVQRGYALFVNEVQVHELSEVQSMWAELEGSPEVICVPALAGGRF